MTTPTDDERVGTVMREMLSSGAARPPSMTPDELRRLAQRKTLRRVDAKVLVALAAVAAVIVTLIVVGPLRSTNRPGHSSVATRPSTSTTTTTTSTTVPGDETRQIVYDPFTTSGAVSPSLHVTATVSAKTPCFSSGVAGNSSYRCFAGNSVYDPCFAPPGATSGPLLCTSDPASRDVVELTTSALPASAQTLPPPLAGTPEQRAWAIQLADGQVCVLIDAAWGGLGPLGCGPTPPGPEADCREPVAGAESWTTTCQDQDTDASPFTTATVVIVWF